jgi:hypothetical protein
VKNLTLLSLLALATGFVMMMSCKKGDTGPAGATGPDSVQYSAWKTLAMTAMNAGDTSFYEDFTVTALTQKIISHGAVLGYFGYLNSAGDTIVQNASEVMTSLYTVGTIEVQSYYVDLSGYFYRYVLVPGNVVISSIPGSTKTYTIDQLKKMSYQQVTQSLGIPAKGGSLKLNSSN